MKKIYCLSIARTTPINVVITTTHPAINAKTLPPSQLGSDSVPPIIANPTDKETITPVNQATKFSTLPCFAMLNLLFYLII